MQNGQGSTEKLAKGVGGGQICGAGLRLQGKVVDLRGIVSGGYGRAEM